MNDVAVVIIKARNFSDKNSQWIPQRAEPEISLIRIVFYQKFPTSMSWFKMMMSFSPLSRN